MYRVALSFDGEPTQWSAWSTETFKEFSNLSEGSYQLQIQGKDVYDKLSEPISYKFTILAPWYRTWYAFAAYFIVFNLVVWLIIRLNTRRIRLDKIKLESIVVERTAEVNKQKEELSAQADFLIKANDKLHSQNIKIEKQQAELRSQTEILQETNIQLTDKNEEILLQKEEIIATAETLKTANEQITEQNRLITDSIRYARRIQDAVLPHKKALAAFFAESVIFYQPRNIVSGDFYWIKSVGNKVLIALADCTGHGVPGAFMSMLSIAMLNEIVRKKDIDNCAAVLEELRIQIKSSLHQTGKEKEPKDGLDICLVSYDIGNRQIEYSGANMPLYLVRNAEIIEYKPVRNPIGIYWVERPFVNTQIQLEIGDFLYMTSDGYLDQFGRQNAEKFRVARFRSLITELASKSGSEQEQILADTIQNWMLPNNKQIDDILVLGFQI
jgi:serine phosphatase RsbU (regulator of sigma subunit)